MQPYYYELTVVPSCCTPAFCDFLLEATDEAVEEQQGRLIVRSEEELETLAWGVEQFALALAEHLGASVQARTLIERKENHDWIEHYRRSIAPVEVPPFYVRPSWHPPKEGVIDLLIDPSLSFGSGHHESTAGCLALLGRNIRPGMRLLDVGCGSGILAIAAMKMGAVAEMCDTDPEAILGAKANMESNGVSCVRIWEGSVHEAQGSYDLVVANIVADVLIALARPLVQAVRPGGRLLLSGIITSRVEEVRQAFGSCVLAEEIEAQEWHTLLFQTEIP